MSVSLPEPSPLPAKCVDCFKEQRSRRKPGEAGLPGVECVNSLGLGVGGQQGPERQSEAGTFAVMEAGFGQSGTS